MAACVVWIDKQTAKVFQFRPGQVEPRVFHRAHHEHHDRKNAAKDIETEKMFHEVADFLRGADEILLVGPGQAKIQFQNHLERHHHQDVAGKLIGVETLDHLTDNQIVAMARKTFTAKHLFT